MGGVYPVLIDFEVRLDAVNSISLELPAVFGTARQDFKIFIHRLGALALEFFLIWAFHGYGPA